MSNEQIAHDLALLWVKEAIEGNVARRTKDKSIVDEYLSTFQHYMELLETRTGKEAPSPNQ